MPCPSQPRTLSQPATWLAEPRPTEPKHACGMVRTAFVVDWNACPDLQDTHPGSCRLASRRHRQACVPIHTRSSSTVALPCASPVATAGGPSPTNPGSGETLPRSSTRRGPIHPWLTSSLLGPRRPSLPSPGPQDPSPRHHPLTGWVRRSRSWRHSRPRRQPSLPRPRRSPRTPTATRWPTPARSRPSMLMAPALGA